MGGPDNSVMSETESSSDLAVKQCRPPSRARVRAFILPQD